MTVVLSRPGHRLRFSDCASRPVEEASGPIRTPRRMCCSADSVSRFRLAAQSSSRRLKAAGEARQYARVQLSASRQSAAGQQDRQRQEGEDLIQDCGIVNAAILHVAAEARRERPEWVAYVRQREQGRHASDQAARRANEAPPDESVDVGPEG